LPLKSGPFELVSPPSLFKNFHFRGQQTRVFRAEGLNVELIQIAGSPAVVALLSGDIDYITHNSRIVASAVRSGGVKSVFNYVAKPIYYLVTLPEI
jgi:ABC-type nitrate/sulfonate/bicarbonate transport system substrate-binding protein